MKRFFSFFSEMIRHQKKWFAKWHTWAGIFAGSILIIVSLTGSLLVFEEELDVWFYPELFDFQEVESPILPMGEVFSRVNENHPDIPFAGIFIFPNRNNAYSMFYEQDDEFYQALVNPYTAEVTGIRIYNKSVMGFIRNLHRTLLVPTVGKYIVGFASLFMVILMITGLRLWIPKHWKNVKERLTIKKGASFKRQNYDLHNMLGFYFSPFITMISITGVTITFSNFVILALFLIDFQSPQSIGDILGKRSTYQETTSMPIKEILTIAHEDMPHAYIRGFTIPQDSVGAYNVNFVAENEVITGDNSFALYDQYTGKKLLNTDKDFPNTAKIPLNWLTSIHYGTFGGMPTRILALITTLVAPALFISGFIVWWGRWKKRKSGSYDKDDMLLDDRKLKGTQRSASLKRQIKPVIPNHKNPVQA